MFVLYWGMVSFITPPVALAAFAAAPIAKTSQMRIGIQAMRLGTAIYVVPFCFALNPALLLRGDPVTVVASIIFAFLGIGVAAAALQGYVMTLGRIPTSPAGWLARALVLAGGVYMAIPVQRVVGLEMPAAIAVGFALACAGLGLLYWLNKTIGRNKA
jgi:TRAP-type uncharacterized transport system fused permease subunit